MPNPPPVALLIPVFDDWEAAGLLCRELDRASDSVTRASIRIYLVDDGSSTAPPADAFAWPARAVRSIASIRLRRNVGHQRAIALGLAYLYDQTDSSAALVMDGDGEDKATDAIALVHQHLSDPTRIIFASRRRRLEGQVFKIGYALYRVCHRVLTGIEVRIGNFSIVPRHLVAAIVVSSESWSHYAASVVKARLPFTTVPLDRGERLAGRSRMNYVTLVTHGLSAMSVFRELVGTRLLLASTAAAAAIGAAILLLLALAAIGRISVDQGTGILVALIVLVALQALAASFVVAFSILGARDQSSFLPIRDYHHFVDTVVTLNGER
jgi:hypothetical protein